MSRHIVKEFNLYAILLFIKTLSLPKCLFQYCHIIKMECFYTIFKFKLYSFINDLLLFYIYIVYKILICKIRM